MNDNTRTNENNNLDNQLNDIPVSTNDLYEFTDNQVHSYTKLSDKYEDIKSSAYTMLIVGLAGIIFMVLVSMNIITLPLNSETSWLFKSVLGGVFIIFVVSGIISFLHAKQVRIDAEEEDQLIQAIETWAFEHLSTETLDDGLDMTQPNEILYFGRAEQIKNLLMHEFETADEPLIDEMTEQIYQKLYED